MRSLTLFSTRENITRKITAQKRRGKYHSKATIRKKIQLDQQGTTPVWSIDKNDNKHVVIHREKNLCGRHSQMVVKRPITSILNLSD